MVAPMSSLIVVNGVSDLELPKLNRGRISSSGLGGWPGGGGGTKLKREVGPPRLRPRPSPLSPGLEKVEKGLRAWAAGLSGCGSLDPMSAVVRLIDIVASGEMEGLWIGFEF